MTLALPEPADMAGSGSADVVAIIYGGRRVRSIPTTGGLVFNSCADVKGWSFRESTGTAGAVVELYDGTSESGTLIASISLTEGQSTRDWLSEHGIEARVGVYCYVASGAVTGAVWVKLPE